ncbi:hypothetical protein H261_21718 [Paramagnetospirillum caucaseum]|uniref:Glycosyltransferase RgtA/B/C/D-like domain-containing protein n=1 Tax=Paramagnetospirillum caucaseum TaxID=1244869 RepID=M3A5N3_9PROT|nr:hypothetical protein [Paramagnetospirillum caucaseum]EME67789.1 hypothetical protein H261_21718 [Paramagnetospirillum caucaseum]
MKLPQFIAGSPAILSQIHLEIGPVVASLTAVAVLAFVGRFLLSRAEPAPAFAAGMGFLVLISTAIGVGGLDLRLALFLAAAAALATLARDRRNLGGWARTALPVTLIAVPLLLLLSDRRGSEWDEFSHWLHAFRYVRETFILPGGPSAPPMPSCCTAYPYGWPMAGLAAMVLSGFSEAVPALLNTLLLVLFAVTLISLARREAAGTVTLPMAAMGFLAATAFSPTFVHKLVFSAYADVATAFLVAMLVLMGERITGSEDNGERGRWSLAFGLAGVALMGVKPGNAALFGCILGGSALLALRRGGLRALLRMHWLPMILLPALCSGLWRWHVDQYLAGREMVILPREHWHVAQIPQILLAMADVASNKGGHFGLSLVMVVLGIRGFIRDRSLFDRLCALAAMLFLGYNLFLLVTYVVVFGDYEALHVASYWRYNTHLGLAMMLPAAVLAGRGLGAVAHTRPIRWLGRAAVVLTLAVPVILASQIRFDHDLTKPFLRQSLHAAGAAMPMGARATVIDPSGSGLSGVMATYEWSGRVKMVSYLSAFSRADLSIVLKQQEADWAFVYSGQARMGLEPVSAALLLHREGTVWNVVEHFPYPGGITPERWP